MLGNANMAMFVEGGSDFIFSPDEVFIDPVFTVVMDLLTRNWMAIVITTAGFGVPVMGQEKGYGACVGIGLERVLSSMPPN